jgi:hypothetical protein
MKSYYEKMLDKSDKIIKKSKSLLHKDIFKSAEMFIKGCEVLKASMRWRRRVVEFKEEEEIAQS